MIGFNKKLAEELAINLGYTSDAVIRELIRRITEELESAPNEEVGEVWQEYRAYLREIGSQIHELLYKISIDESIDPEVSEPIQTFLGQRSEP